MLFIFGEIVACSRIAHEPTFGNGLDCRHGSFQFGFGSSINLVVGFLCLVFFVEFLYFFLICNQGVFGLGGGRRELSVAFVGFFGFRVLFIKFFEKLFFFLGNLVFFFSDKLFLFLRHKLRLEFFGSCLKFTGNFVYTIFVVFFFFSEIFDFIVRLFSAHGSVAHEHGNSRRIVDIRFYFLRRLIFLRMSCLFYLSVQARYFRIHLLILFFAPCEFFFFFKRLFVGLNGRFFG